MAKKITGFQKLALAGLAISAVAAFAFGKQKGDIVSAKSGKTWRVVMLSNTGGVKTYEVFSPAGSFGPHGELSVIRYTQQGSDVNSRTLLGVGAGVPAVMVTTAGSDFGVPVNPALIPGS